MSMHGRDPPDNFVRQLDAAREAVLANITDPWHAVEPFEPILEELTYDPVARAEKLPLVRSLGRELYSELRSAGRPVAMEVRHYCWHLEHLGAPTGPASTILKDLLMVTLTRFAHYRGHRSDWCSVCAEFPADLPFQGSPGGRAHFYEWLKQKSRVDGASP
jgi:hypothetical protein